MEPKLSISTALWIASSLNFIVGIVLVLLTNNTLSLLIAMLNLWLSGWFLGIWATR